MSRPSSCSLPNAVLMLLANAYEPDPRVREEALALVEAGCRVRVLGWDRDIRHPASECMEGVEVRRVFVRSTHGRGATQILSYALVYLKMLRAAWRDGFDAVHCHDLDMLPLGYLLGRCRRRPIVYDAHESFPDMLAGSVPGIVRRALFRLEDYLIRRVDLLITVGEKLRRNFAARGARRSATVGNWKRLEDYERSPAQNLALRRRLGIPGGALAVACITRLLPDRKIEELLDAVDQTPGVYAIVGGAGALEKLVRKRAAANPRILYPGFVPAGDIPAYTCAADAVYYGFDPENPNARFSAPNKLYEALAAGKPLITGDFGEIADVVRAARCGFVLPRYSAEAVRHALEQLADPARRAELAENARRHGRTAMNWAKGRETLYREYSALFRPALAGASSEERV